MIVESCAGTDHSATINIDVDISKKISLMFSGGLDSSTLLYLMCLDIIQKGHEPKDVIKYLFTVPKADGAEIFPPKVLDFLQEKLGKELPPMTIARIPKLHGTYHGMMVWNTMLYILEKYDIDQIYLGDQRPIDGLDDDNKPTRSQDIEGPRPGIMIFPFNHLYKYHTIDVMFNEGLGQLMHLSHSCTEKIIGRCNLCYHCKERAEGFRVAGYVDESNK